MPTAHRAASEPWADTCTSPTNASCFEPHGFDAGLSGRTVSVALRDITDVRRAPRDLRHFFGGGLRARMAVTTPHETHLFVVNDIGGKIQKIQERRSPCRG